MINFIIVRLIKGNQLLDEYSTRLEDYRFDRLKTLYDIGNSLIERASDGKYPFYLNTMLRPLFNCRINVRPNVRSSDQCRLQSPTNVTGFEPISNGERGGGGGGEKETKRKGKKSTTKRERERETKGLRKDTDFR